MVLTGASSNQAKLIRKLAAALPSLLQRDLEPPDPLPQVRGKHLRDERLAELLADYAAGLNMRPLAHKYGIHRFTVAAHLRRAGIELRYQGLSDDQVREAAQRYRDGWSLQRLAERYDCTAETVRQALKAERVVMRKPWERG